MTLYRKYRPKKFSEVVGRDSISKILVQEIKDERVSHAYLFSGTRGTGKTTMARLFAKALNCAKRDKKTGEPCNECSSCSAINQGRAQDLVEIDAASNRRIEEIRELREHVKYVPSQSKYKVYIIDEVHMLTTEAFNALLKTLEEPPSQVIFILATTELHKIPETIFSRCQHFSFGKVAVVDMVDRLKRIIKLENAEVSEDVIADIARRSGGALRDAESLLGQILSIGKKIGPDEAALFLPKIGFGRTIEWLKFIIDSDANNAIASLDEMEQEGINLNFFLSEVLETARQMMLYVATKDQDRLKLYFTPDETEDIKQACADASHQKLRQIVIELLRAQQDMKLSPDIPSLPIELAVILICDSNTSSGPAESARRDPLNKEQQENNQESIVLSVDAPTPPNPSLGKGGIDIAKHCLEDILDGWGEVLTKVKDKNQALNFVLGVAQPVSVNGGTLELGFKYKLQQEKIAEFKNREIVENIIKEVYGTNYRIEPVLRDDMVSDNASQKPSESQNLEEQEEDEFVKVALEVFEGAEIIN